MSFLPAVRWAVLGFTLGSLVSTASIWPDFFHRVRWAMGGGSGETANWDEPLFYIVVIGVPWGLGCGLITLVIAVAIRWLPHRTK